MTKEYTQLDLINAAIDSALYDVHTMIPAKIIKVDSYEQQKITVQPSIKDRNRDYSSNDKGLQDMALITGVPVIFPSAGTGIITFPIKVGDPVMLIFSERSLENYLYGDGGKPVDPEDFRKHDYNDVVALAGFYPFQKALGIDPNDVVIRMNVGTANESKVSLKPSGDVVVDTPAKFIVNATSNVEINTSANAVVNVGGTTNISSGGAVTIDATVVNINTNVNVSGTLTASVDVIGGGKSLKNHTHNVAAVANGGATKTSTSPN